MRSIFTTSTGLALVAGLWLAVAPIQAAESKSGANIVDTTSTKSVYDFTVKNIDGEDVALSKYKGDVLLIVNVASK